MAKKSRVSVVVVVVQSLSRVQLFETPWIVAHQASLSMGFPRQEHWSGLPFSTPEYLPDAGIQSMSLVSPALVGRFLTIAPPGRIVFKIKRKIKGKDSRLCV